MNIPQNMVLRLGNSQVVVRLGDHLIYDGEQVVVPVIEPNLLLRLNFAGNLNDTSGNNIPFNTDLSNANLQFSLGRKPGTLAALFDGTFGLKSMNELGQAVPINTATKSLCISFHMKSTQTEMTSLITLADTNFISENGLGLIMNYSTNKLLIVDNENSTGGSTFVNAGVVPSQDFTSWRHIVINIDRNLPASTQTTIYVDKVQKYVFLNQIGYNQNNNLNYVPKTLGIGMQGSSSLGTAEYFEGQIQDLEIYDRTLTTTEIAALFDKNSPTLTNKNVLLSGDSIITSHGCRPDTIASRLFTTGELSAGYSATNIAVGGHTINSQKTAWEALPNKTQYDIIIVQVGFNDFYDPFLTIISNYQSYIDSINSTKRADAKVYISCLTPARNRWVNLGVPQAQLLWEEFNRSIMGVNNFPITGVSGRNDYHVLPMDDGTGALKSIYDCGDGIHENQDGAGVIIKGFRKLIFG